MEVLLHQLYSGCHFLTAGQASARSHGNSLLGWNCEGKIKEASERSGLMILKKYYTQVCVKEHVLVVKDVVLVIES